MTFVSLFTGIGGIDLGLERAGMQCVGQVEIDEYCRRVLAKRWPGVRRWDDARTFPPDPIDDWRADLICGGDPCQENSNARQGTGLEHPSLGGEFIRIVDAFRPWLVLRENPAVVRADAPWRWWRFRAALERLDYVVLPFRLRACCLGADHQRDRLFLLGERADAMQTGLQGAILEEMERATRQRLGDAAERNRWHPAPRICRGTDGVPYRVDRLRALGNAVVPQVAEWIGRRILEAVER